MISEFLRSDQFSDGTSLDTHRVLLECIGDGTSTFRTDVVVPETQSGEILVETRRRDQFSDGTSLDTHRVLLECIGDGTSTFRTDVVVPERQSGEILVGDTTERSVQRRNKPRYSPCAA